MNFLTSSACKIYIYTMLWSVKCTVAFCLKKRSIYLKKNALLLKNASHHLSLQWVIIFAGGRSCLSVDGFWLIRVVVVEDWGSCGDFQSKIAVKFSTWIDFFFHQCILCSMRCCLNILPPVELLPKLESVLSNPAAALSTKFM